MSGSPAGAAELGASSTSAPGLVPPQWSDAQLRRRLMAGCGIRVTRPGDPSRRHGVVDAATGVTWVLDVPAAAKVVGVSARTIQRWLSSLEPTTWAVPEATPGSSTTQAAATAKRPVPVRMRAASRQRVWASLRPSERRLRQEDLDLAYALEAIRTLSRKRAPKVVREQISEWAEDGWLQPHMVAILGVPLVGAWQLTLARLDGRPLEELVRRSGYPGVGERFTEVPTRFHARALVQLALREVDPWRVRLAKPLARQGHTWAWTDDAGAGRAGDAGVDLGALAVTNRLR